MTYRRAEPPLQHDPDGQNRGRLGLACMVSSALTDGEHVGHRRAGRHPLPAPIAGDRQEASSLRGPIPRGAPDADLDAGTPAAEVTVQDVA